MRFDKSMNVVRGDRTISADNGLAYLTDDGKDYTYVYDAFLRLRKVKTRAGALVAE